MYKIDSRSMWDEIPHREFTPLVSEFRAFLGADNLRRTQIARDARIGGNPFRSALLREKQPWVDAMAEFERLTLVGSRPLPKSGVPKDVFRAALAARLLRKVLPTLSDEHRSQMRARLLDLDGRASSVMMEWDTAYFYLRRGYRVSWLPIGEGGPEFRAVGPDHALEVECKRVSRRAAEQMSDRQELTLIEAIINTIEGLGLCGNIRVDADITECPSREDVAGGIGRLLDGGTSAWNDVEICKGVRLTGELLPWTDAPPISPKEMRQRLESCPVDCRRYGAAVPFNSKMQNAIALSFHGPRLPTSEYLKAVENRLREGAEQLSGECPGFVIMELEGIEDATLFRDKAVFRNMGAGLFTDFPHVAGILWRADTDGDIEAYGYRLSRQAFEARSMVCKFEETESIPLLDPE